MKKIYLFLFLIFFSSLSFAQTDSTGIKDLTGLSLEDLMNIKVVTAMGFNQTVTEAPSTIRVITAQQIEERGYEQLEDVLRDIEGVDIIHLSGYMPSIFYFRGLYGAENLRTLILIDGIRDNNLVGSPELAGPAYSLHNVVRIEIIWGPASALYGADAFGGVINIITKKGGEVNGLHYEKGFGSFNTSEDKVIFGTKRKDFDIVLSGSLYSTEGPRYLNRGPHYNGAFVDKAWSFNGSVTHSKGKFKTTLGFRAFDSPMSWGNILNSATKILQLPSQGYNNSGAIGILTENIRNERPGIYEPYSNASYIQTEFTANKNLTLFAQVSYQETGTSDKSYIYLSIDTNLGPGLDTNAIYRVPSYNYSNRVKGKLNATYKLTSSQTFTAGIDYSEDNLESGSRSYILDTNKYMVDGLVLTNLNPAINPRIYSIRNNFGSFLQYQLNTTLLRKTSFTLGARYDKNTDFESPLSPRIAIVTSPAEKLTIKLLYGTSFRSLTVTEVNAAIATFGSRVVNPEKVSTFEANVIYTITKKWLVQLNGFHNRLSDIFVLNSLTGSGFQQQQTQGEAVVTGGEFHLDLFASDKLSGFLNFSVQHGIQTDTKTNTEFDIPNIPDLKGNAGVTHTIGQLYTLSLIANWVGDRQLPHSNPYGADKNYKMKGYFTGNVTLTTKKLFNNHASAVVIVKNVFNEKYLDPGIRTADGLLYSTVLEQPGRSILFKVTIDLF